MDSQDTRKQFQSSFYVQEENGDVHESGWIAILDGDHAKIGWFFCPIAEEDDEWNTMPLTELVEDWAWQGTTSQLMQMAERKANPWDPDRPATEEQENYDELMIVYSQILDSSK